MLTSGLNALPETLKAHVIERVKTFSEFDAANDPHGEHDFISFEIEGQQFSAGAKPGSMIFDGEAIGEQFTREQVLRQLKRQCEQNGFPS